jgi:hypothetical protein
MTSIKPKINEEERKRNKKVDHPYTKVEIVYTHQCSGLNIKILANQ